MRDLIRDGKTDGGFVLLCSYSLKKPLVSGSILVHAGALFIPLILIVAAKMIIHILRLHIFKLCANGALQPFIQIKHGTVMFLAIWVTSI